MANYAWQTPCVQSWRVLVPARVLLAHGLPFVNVPDAVVNVPTPDDLTATVERARLLGGVVILNHAWISLLQFRAIKYK